MSGSNNDNPAHIKERTMLDITLLIDIGGNVQSKALYYMSMGF